MNARAQLVLPKPLLSSAANCQCKKNSKNAQVEAARLGDILIYLVSKTQIIQLNCQDTAGHGSINSACRSDQEYIYFMAPATLPPFGCYVHVQKTIIPCSPTFNGFRV